ncbi:MAG: HK97 family phage prohead protease [Oscillospiraceae bacterium]|nr:HK97 family phage prohead protease [Oscillospiraceae bacterium]
MADTRKNKTSLKNAVSTREIKSFKFELESADEATGEFSGYAAVFGNVDAGGDVIERGAFAKTIVDDFDRIKILSLHDNYDLPIGKPIELREDGKGLYIRGKISDTQKGRDIQTLLKDGVLTEMSIGYDAVAFDYDSESNIRHLKEIKLWEISIVTWAMNDQAKIDEVKSLVESLSIEAKSGKLSRARLNTLKPFITVLKELAEILSPFLELAALEEQEQDDGNQNNIAKTKQRDVKQTKSDGMIFKIIPRENRR